MKTNYYSRNRKTTDENLEIDELVSFIQDGNYKMYVNRATKVSTAFPYVLNVSHMITASKFSVAIRYFSGTLYLLSLL
jgi:hypothetical protein